VTAEEVVLTVDLPYVEREAVQLKVNEDSVDISAELRKPIRYDRWGTIQRGCEFKRFSVMIPLPTEVDPDGAKAKLRDGVLAVELSKKAKGSTVKID
jgi:HSP20 family protein